MIHIGIVILGEYVQYTHTKQEVLVDYIIEDYKKILYPPNYQNLDIETAEKKYNDLLKPISDKLSFRAILKSEVISVLLYIFATIIFGFALTVFYSFFTELERNAISLFFGVFDSVAKGMLFDLFESYGLGFATYEKNTFFLKTIDFLIRTFASLIVLSKAIKLVQGLRARFRYKKIISDPVTKYEFFVVFYRKLQLWGSSVPEFLGSYPNIQNKLDESLIEFLWQTDGDKVPTSFLDNYKRLQYREAREYLESHLLNIPYDFKMLDEQTKSYFESKRAEQNK